MIRKISFVLTMLLAANSLFAGGVSENKEGLYNPVPDIMHHISDSYEWHITGKGKTSVTIPLPLILYVDGKVDMFMSSKFKHGKSDVVCGDRIYYVDDHGHISERSGLPIINMSITKNVAYMLISFVVLLLIFIFSGRSANKQKEAQKDF